MEKKTTQKKTIKKKISPKKIVKKKIVRKKTVKKKIAAKSEVILNRKISRKKPTGIKISNGFAFTVVVACSLALGIFAWVNSQQVSYAYDVSPRIAMKKVNQNTVKTGEIQKVACTDHYYDGESKVKAWLVGDINENEILIGIIGNDLPAQQGMVSENGIIVRLIDATSAVKNKLKQSEKNDPTTITIKGYATTCNSAYPLVSLGLMPKPTDLKL